MNEHHTISLWESSATEAPVAGAFESTEVETAIVGGGFTGLATALHLAEAGRTALVIEAAGIGNGGSGRNVGLVNAGVWHPPAKVRQALGPTYGDRFLKFFGDGPQTVFDLIERHQIRCAATRTGTLHAAHAPRGMVDLQARHDAWAAMGAPVTLLNRADMAEMAGTRVFFGGLLDRRAGTINPMAYCRGLARAAVAAGARIATNAPVTGLRREGTGWRVDTAQGVITSRTVVLATNAYTDGLWPGLAQSFTPIHYFHLATEPLGDAGAHILPGQQGLWDTGRIMVSVRRDAEGRLLLGSMGRARGALTRKWGARQIARLFPELGQVAIEDVCDGRIALTPDHLPRICELDQGLYTAIGYNGRGITTGTLFGRSLAGLISGEDPADLPLPVMPLPKLGRMGVMAHAYEAAFTAQKVLRSL
ncbi:MAG: FAD-binding oxidoreductase [Pseudomonadota bacterium]